MKEESVLNVLMYLFQNHMNDRCRLESASGMLYDQLEAAGFQEDTINDAIDWLEKLVVNDAEFVAMPSDTATRVYASVECDLLDLECKSFLMNLETQEILTPVNRELVLNQLFELRCEEIDIGLIKWVALMVLHNRPADAYALDQLEFLALDSAEGGTH